MSEPLSDLETSLLMQFFGMVNNHYPEAELRADGHVIDGDKAAWMMLRLEAERTALRAERDRLAAAVEREVDEHRLAEMRADGVNWRVHCGIGAERLHVALAGSAHELERMRAETRSEALEEAARMIEQAYPGQRRMAFILRERARVAGGAR